MHVYVPVPPVGTHVPPLRQGCKPHGFAMRHVGPVNCGGQLQEKARPLLIAMHVPVLHGADKQGLRIV